MNVFYRGRHIYLFVSLVAVTEEDVEKSIEIVSQEKMFELRAGTSPQKNVIEEECWMSLL